MVFGRRRLAMLKVPIAMLCTTKRRTVCDDLWYRGNDAAVANPKLSDINCDKSKITDASYSVAPLGGSYWKYVQTNGATCTVTCNNNYRVLGDLGRNTLTYTCDLNAPKWNSNGESCTKGQHLY